jgi:hypothetical protein
MKLQIALNSARGRSTTLTAERLINLFAEKAPEGAESTSVTHGAPGLVTFVSLLGACRGITSVLQTMYVVSGTSLYSVTQAGVTAVLGTVPGTGLVSVRNNGDIIVIVTNPDAYTYTVSTGTFAQVTDANYAGAHSVEWINQTFVFANDDFHFIGAVGGLLPFDPLMAASAESSPDAIVGLAKDHNELLIYGSSTLEGWQYVQTTDATAYPFDAITGATGEKGLAGRYAIVQLDNTTVWLDQNGIVRRLTAGYVPTRISTEAIEHQLASATLSTAEMLVYIMEGHEFFALNTDVGTFVYDANTGLWHDRISYGLDRWKAQRSIYIWGAWYVGNYESGFISRLDLDTNTENDDFLIGTAIFPPIVFGRDRFTVNDLELAVDTATGTLTTDPIVSLRTSRNGSTWSNGAQRGMGKTGERDGRVNWRALGQWDKLHVRFDIADPYKRAVYAAYASIEKNDQ